MSGFRLLTVYVSLKRKDRICRRNYNRKVFNLLNVKPSDFRYNDYKYLVILCAAVTQPVSKSLLKYSTVYPIRGDCPVLELRLQDIVTEVDRRSTIFGFVGG